MTAPYEREPDHHLIGAVIVIGLLIALFFAVSYKLFHAHQVEAI